jgi:hypothetical protein
MRRVRERPQNARDRVTNLVGIHAVAAGGDVLLQHFAVGDLWEPELHDFVQQLVNDDKVVSNAFLLHRIKVIREQSQQTVQKDHQHGGVRVLLCHSQN